jgi:pyridoxine/pyridoxamine 5'-phosphate oxidase
MDRRLQQIVDALNAEYTDAARICSLATSDSTGTPSVRCMVLREITSDGAFLFVSDRRTAKDDHLRARPECEVMFWLPKRNTQIRIAGHAVVVDAANDYGLREDWWHRLDTRGTRILSKEKGTDPDTTPMPATFELITVTPTTVRFDDYSQTPAKKDVWTFATR